MITDIPTPADFDAAGRGFLNLAFDTVADLYSMLSEAGFANRSEDEDDQRIREEFWSKAQTSLQIAAILVGQASEFLLKGRIAQVSPLLLLEPRAFQTGAKAARFAELRTINAEDLVTVHDAVLPQPLAPDYAAFLNALRTRRNAVVHTVDGNRRIEPRDIALEILRIVNYLVGNHAWIQMRWEYHAETPLAAAQSTDIVDYQVHRDVMAALFFLRPSEVREHLAFDPKQRRYVCTPCSYAIDDRDAARTAILEPNTPDAEQVRCFVCSRTQTVQRAACPNEECLGNVLGVESGICLTCGEETSDL